jgi:hypothetical protein
VFKNEKEKLFFMNTLSVQFMLKIRNGKFPYRRWLKKKEITKKKVVGKRNKLPFFIKGLTGCNSRLMT